MPKQNDKKKIKTTKKTTVKKNKMDCFPENHVAVQKLQESSVPERTWPIVGIGASAGGLEAFSTFFSAMPEDSGIAFVLVPHLDPHHVSLLPEILQKKTKMQVRQVTDNMKVESNHVYIIPPDRNMAILNGSLQLLEMKRRRGIDLPIDNFLRSLAQDQGSNAIGIILSGTGSDGTIGIRAIKGENGMVMVQDHESAQYDGMPMSATATGLADYVLSPDKMPEHLIKYVKHASKKSFLKTGDEGNTNFDALQKIYVLLRNRTNYDFSQYKKNTIYRRIERRMNVHQIDNIADYIRYLQKSGQEVEVLFKELLIGVTSFFRDPELYEVLKEEHLPKLLKDKPDDYSIRVWVPGCSSGEEVYSLAIILFEYINAGNQHFNVQIFGTDIDAEAIDRARIGRYPENIATDIRSDRLKNFFSKDNNTYQVKKMIREMVIFAQQNIIKDPPFTKLDIVSCRNLLIYFESTLQQKVLPMFHYSLKENGILVLGTSETTGKSADLFSLEDRKWKIFLRKGLDAACGTTTDFSGLMPTSFHPGKKIVPPPNQPENSNDLRLLVLQQSDIPSCVIIDDQANVVFIHGRTGRFLEPAEGVPKYNILEMVRPGLKMGLATAIRKVATHRREEVVENLQVKTNRDVTKLNLIVRPIREIQPGYRGLMMVIFDDSKAAKDKDLSGLFPQSGKTDEAASLRDELQYTKQNLQATIEEVETSNEELRSANEELQSTNEELQSTNEELETSREELQSLNEESNTVNAELQGRIDELAKSNDDMKNLLLATQIATIFVDTDLCVTRFTPKCTDIVPLTSQDSGRPLSHFAANLKGPKLADYATQVLEDLVIRDIQVESNDGKYFRMRVMPYRTTNNVVNGVVFTFDEISNLLKAQADSRLLATIVKVSSDAIIIQDLDGNVIAWNGGAEKLYGWCEEEALQMNISTLVPAREKEESAALIQKVMVQEVKPFAAKRITKEGAEIDVWITANKIVNDENEIVGISTIERDLPLMASTKLRQV